MPSANARRNPSRRPPVCDRTHPRLGLSPGSEASMIADIVQTGLASWWAPALAFVAGLVSFASPCVFPLVPGYISFVSGERAVDGQSRRPVAPILLFITGFTIVFTLLFAFSRQ